MRLWRVLAWDDQAAPDAPGGPLWFPRELQGEGRHDNPDLYGCLYVSERPASAVAEQLAQFRGAGRLHESMLVRGVRPLALAALDLADRTELLDLDEPTVLGAQRLRPSVVATRHRSLTQVQAARLWIEHQGAAALRWWSTLEATWINLTLFDRARESLGVIDVHVLTPDAAEVRDAGEQLGLRPA